MGNEQDAVDDAWAWFKESGSAEARNWLVIHYQDIIPSIAAKAYRRLQGYVEMDDLVSFGSFGLMDAVERFDPGRTRIDAKGVERKITFKTYATPRIWGQMFDEVRKLSWVPRNALAAGRDLDRGREEIEIVLGRPATHAELAEHLGMGISEYWKVSDQSQISLVPLVNEITTTEFDSFESTQNSAEIDHASNPEDAYQVNHIASMISEAVAGMNERLRTILALYYIEDLTYDEIGEKLGVTGGRVCQLVGRALTELQGDLGGVLAA